MEKTNKHHGRSQELVVVSFLIFIPTIWPKKSTHHNDLTKTLISKHCHANSLFGHIQRSMHIFFVRTSNIL